LDWQNCPCRRWRVLHLEKEAFVVAKELLKNLFQQQFHNENDENFIFLTYSCFHSKISCHDGDDKNEISLLQLFFLTTLHSITISILDTSSGIPFYK
jgi:hypothetical protein